MLTDLKKKGLLLFGDFGVLLIILILLSFVAVPPLAAYTELPPDLSELSLEALMDIEVTSVSKKPQRLADSATAIYVITQEDIRRSGVTSIPEALRMAPGVQVAHIDNNSWGISVRGFNSFFANKLLVLIDGRSVYTPLFSGVYWNVQDTMLEDINRIEVIRGPGATLWGANAVNGVINIITKNSADTQGYLLSAGAGDQERGFSSLRYGDKIGKNITYRVFAKYFDRDCQASDTHDPADSWHSRRGGFRMDGRLTHNDTFTFQGDIYDTDTGNTLEYYNLSPPYEYTGSDSPDMKGGNILMRWQRSFSSISDLELQAYYDRTELDESIYKESRDTYDLDFQHRFQPSDFQEIIWGLGYHFTRDNMDGNAYAKANKTYHRSDDLFSAFIQDEISLIPEKLTLILGSKLEHNDYTGYEVQPNARLLLRPNKDHTLWAAVSRAVRTPSRAEHDSRITVDIKPNPATPWYPLPTKYELVSSTDFDSEELTAYELGYRYVGFDCLTFDLAVFYNDYNKLRTIRMIDLQPRTGYYYIANTFENNSKGSIYGGEAVIVCRPQDWLTLQAIYSYQYETLEMTGHNTAEILTHEIGANPHHQASLRSQLDLPENIELDFWFRYVDALPDKNTDSYITMDMRIGWQPVVDFNLDLVGQNLLDKEFPQCNKGTQGIVSTEVERSFYLKATWRF